ncbi:MAG: hypothetical protein L0H70_04790 [Xanthomonadales bacterium]|nr:hypothetical protein [Xanthomonadales bacterium]
MNRIGTIVRLIGSLAAVLLLAATATPSYAENNNPGFYNQHVLPILPYRGMYYEVGHGGTGLSLDVEANGYTFGIFYTYDADGSGHPTYLMIEGQYQQAKDKDRLQSGILGTLDATPYKTANGECIGAGCTYHNPDRTATNLHVHLEWTAPRRVTVTIGDQSWHMQGGQYTVADTDLLVGQWNWGDSTAGGVLATNAVHPVEVLTVKHSTLTPSDFPVVTSSDDAYRDGDVVVPANAFIYDATGVGITSYGIKVSQLLYLWYDADTGVGMLFNSTNKNGVHGVPRRIGDFYIAGPQLLRGRSMNGTNEAVFGDITLTRVYPGSILYQHP